MFFKLARMLSVVLLLALTLSACGPAASNVAEKPPLRVSWTLWPGYYPMAIAVEKGLFAKHGVQVEPVFYPIYNNQLADLAAGMLDASLITLSDSMFDEVSLKAKVVMVVDNSVGADQVVAGPGIASPADLRGKRIGVQSNAISGVLLVREMLARNGLSLADVTLVDVPPEKVPGAIPGLVAAGYTYDPYTSQALSEGGQVLFSSADAPGLIVDVLTFRRAIIAERPEDVRAFVAAWFEAVQYWRDNPQEGNEIIARATGLSPSEISIEGVKLFDQNDNLSAFVQGEDSGSVYFTAQKELTFLTERSKVTRPVRVDDLLDASFLK